MVPGQQGRGWSLWLKQLWEDTYLDSSLGAQVDDEVGVWVCEPGGSW